MTFELLLPSHEAVAICIDSQSLLKAMRSGTAGTSGLRRMLDKRAGNTTLLWILGYHVFFVNVERGACANKAAEISDRAPRPVSFVAASALIRRTLTDASLCHCRIKEFYTKTFSWRAGYRAVLTRSSAVLLSRLRAYANQLDTTVDP